MSERLYFRQLLAGRDFAVDDAVAVAMRNFTYVVGDHETGDALLVDPAYRPSELLALVEDDGMRLSGVVATHYHPDHIGGSLAGDLHVAGIKELCAMVATPVHVQAEEVRWVIERTGVAPGDLVAHHDHSRLEVGDVEVTLLHTPGHTPGSQCLLVEGRLMSGDTLFLDGCGRTDLPGGDAREMFRTLHERLSVVGDEVVVYPGHLYSPEPHLPMGVVRARNAVLAPCDADAWLTAFGG